MRWYACVSGLLILGLLAGCGGVSPPPASPAGVVPTGLPVSRTDLPGPSATLLPQPTAEAPTPTSLPSAVPSAVPPTRIPPTPMPPTPVPPTPTPGPPPSPQPTLDASVSVWEGQVTLNTYGWEQALVPSGPEDPVYPYPRMDFAAVGPPADQTYQVVVLENGYVRVTVLPALGGRILRWEDKVTGRPLTYANPVIKPVNGWGYRGWWLATGGLEWAFPTDEHGLNEYRPWDYVLLSGEDWRGVRVWDTDDRTGLQVEVTMRLQAGRSELLIVPRIFNPTGAAQSFQFWVNAMLTLSGGAAPTAGLRFWVPTGQMTVHSTSDGSLPAPGANMDWPVHAGRDFSRYPEWGSYLGLFATSAAGVVGAYDEVVDQGMVRLYPGDTARGVKIFCLGEIPASTYTDDGGGYFELWGGYTRTFWDYAAIQPGEAVTWEERWFPVHGIGTLAWAGAELAAGLRVVGGEVVVGLYAPVSAEARLVLLRDGVEMASWAAFVGPGSPFLARYSGDRGGWELQVWQGGVLRAQFGP